MWLRDELSKCLWFCCSGWNIFRSMFLLLMFKWVRDFSSRVEILICVSVCVCACLGNYFAGRHPSLLQITIIATTVRRIMLKAKISDKLQQRKRLKVVWSNLWNWRLLNSPSHYAHHQYWLSFRLLCQQRCAVCDLWFNRSEQELNWFEHELIRASWTEYF